MAYWALAAFGFAAVVAAATPARSDTVIQGKAAFTRGNYQRAARLLAPPASAGNPRAQAMLGFMYEHGFGVPQAYDVAADLYCRSAERGDPSGQYLLGLMYDKGHGVERDEVLAYKWLDLAAAGASGRDRENYMKLRDAVASKMTVNQVREGQRQALNWRQR
ncbi:MAG: tetratricopeptide repeat protein [Xanthobacteraceae bacterium]|nr:tetratricopeptide repeat protein [Xanthobacteraceae bacterium]